MNHLDEGTIHAWLDGALSAGQSSDIETHIALCATCSAAVAEARGLVAGASRILGALDDVPAGVIPKAVPAAPGIVRPGGVPARPRWRVAPWAAGIAAVLMAAVVLQTTNMSRDVAERETDAMLSRAPEAGSSVVAESLPAGNPAPPVVLESAPTPRRSAEVQPSAPPVAQSTAAATVGGVSGAPQPPATISAPTEARKAVAAVGMDAQRGESAQASGRAPERAEAAMDQALVLRSVLTTPPTLTPVERLAGCYRLDSFADGRSVGGAAGGAAVAAEAAAAVASRTRGARQAPAAMPAPVPSAPRADFSDARASSLIRLDTARAALGLAVVGARSDSTIGAWRVLRDSARVDLGTRGVAMLSVLQKVNCPER